MYCVTVISLSVPKLWGEGGGGPGKVFSLQKGESGFSSLSSGLMKEIVQSILVLQTPCYYGCSLLPTKSRSLA